ncbi:MAG TPA: diguanylate cyclase [Holophagaceae bacterium]|nr:diguanylate cyclase [Holophagaceae bacterium]
MLGLCLGPTPGGGATARAKELAYGAVPPGRFSFRRYGSEQGLRNLAVLSMLQDRQGFMWMGTEDGLYRYDGHRFQDFGTRDGLPSSYITDMVEDGQGRLWVGTYQGLALREGDRFKPFGPAEGLPEGPIHDLSAGVEEGLWAATPSGPFVLAAGHFQGLHGWPGGAASAVCYRGSSQGWVALWSPAGPSKGSRILEYQGGTWKAWDEPSAFGHERLDSILQDGDGRVWARSSGHLWVLEPGGGQFHEARPGLPPISARAILRPGPGGSVMVPTDRGIYTFSQGAWSVMDEQMGLPTSYVRDVVEDHEGSLWFSSLGVYRLLGRGFWRAYTHSDGLPDDVVWTILRDRSRNLLVGTDRGLAVASAKGWQRYPGTEGNVIRTAVEAPDGTLYMGGSPVEVLRWNPRTRQVDGRFGAESGLVGKRIFRLVLDGQGMLWAATDGGGLLRADTKAPTLHFESQILPGGSATEYVSGLCLGASGRLYASGEYGFAVLENGTWRRFTKADGLERTHVAYCAERRNGDIVLAYFESLGYTRLRLEGGQLKVLGSPDPASELGREKVYMMGEDSKGRLWVGTGRGVYAVKDGEVQHFGLADGLVGEDVDNMAFHSDPGGDVWVGTSAGLARFDASAYKGALKPPPTVFLRAALGGKPQPFEGSVRVPHSQNTLEARYAGLSFLGEGFIQHQVRLAGLEEEWHLSDIDEVRYPALAGGDYVLEVRSRIAQGEWGEPARFSFSVMPAWWQTWWFRLLVVGAAGGAVMAVIRWRLSALRRYNQELEALVHQRTAELEAANEALRNQSLTDPLTGLRNRRYLGVRMSEDVAQVQRTLRQMQEKREGRAEMSVDLVFAMVDLDHFKEVNDTFGHAAGDRVLQQTAEILQQATRESDTVVRWGGEEFLVVARNAARKDATALVERIRATVEAHSFDLEDGRTLRRTCSVGFSFFPFFHPSPEILTWEQVVDMADHCLYAAKRSGRNGWVGISATPSLRLEDLNDRPAQHIPDLLAQGAVEIQSSYPDGAPLHWDKDA